MVADQKFDGGAILFRRGETIENLARDAQGRGDMIAGTFPDIVQQQGEADDPRIGDFGAQIGKAGVGDRFERSDGDEGMFIDGVAMIKIANHEAFDVLPLRQGERERSGGLHGAESERGAREREQALPILEGRLRDESGKAVDGVGSEAQLMARGEFEDAEVLKTAGIAQQDAVARDGELGGGEARAPLMKAA